MKLNYDKVNLMLFNPTTALDFQPDFVIDGHHLKLLEETRTLGLIVRSDLKWTSNTLYIVKKANQRLWLIKRLKNLGAARTDLVDVFTKQIRSVLEFGAPVWQSSITQQEKTDIERVQKSFCKIVLGHEYGSYKSALEVLELENLDSRRIILCLNFALKAENRKKFQHWFKPNLKNSITRLKPSKYIPVAAKHARFEKSPLSYLTELLNMYYA